MLIYLYIFAFISERSRFVSRSLLPLFEFLSFVISRIVFFFFFRFNSAKNNIIMHTLLLSSVIKFVGSHCRMFVCRPTCWSCLCQIHFMKATHFPRRRIRRRQTAKPKKKNMNKIGDEEMDFIEFNLISTENGAAHLQRRSIYV